MNIDYLNIAKIAKIYSKLSKTKLLASKKKKKKHVTSNNSSKTRQ